MASEYYGKRCVERSVERQVLLETRKAETSHNYSTYLVGNVVDGLVEAVR